MTSAKVLWVYQNMRGHGTALEAGQKPSLCLKGRKYMFCVAAGHPVRVIKRPVADFDKLRQVLKGNKEYSVKDALAQLRDIAKRNGITVGASKLLDAALKEATGIDDQDFQDEEELTGTMRIVNEETPAQEVTGDNNPEETNTNNDAAETAEESDVAKAKKAKRAKSAADKKAANATRIAANKQRTADVKAAKKAPKKAAKKVAAKKAAKKAAGRPQGDMAEKASEFFKAQRAKLKDPKNPERGWRKKVVLLAAEKFDRHVSSMDTYFSQAFKK